MSEATLAEIREGLYLDSVVLMRISRDIAALDGVLEAALMMGTPANLDLLRGAALLRGDEAPRSNDLVVAVRARDRETAEHALAAARAVLERPGGIAGGSDGSDRGTTGGRNARDGGSEPDSRPRSIAAAMRVAPRANLAVISVPGHFAAAEARKALRRGLNVLLFSDHVSLEDELALKQEARELGRLLMGPDCGTAILGGVPIAFANRVPRGGIAIVGASGTGMQEIASLTAEAGGGISHAIGVGGRDLQREIGAITTLMALDALDADPRTESVVLVSKPPHPEVTARVLARVGRSAKPFTLCFLGAGRLELPANARQAVTLAEAASLALRAADVEHGRPILGKDRAGLDPEGGGMLVGGDRIGAGFDIAGVARALRPRCHPNGRIEGLFCGGTLAAEAQVVLAAGGRTVASNVPIPGVGGLQDADPGGDRIRDLGADEYTRGRPHPMIDPQVRDDALATVLADPEVALVLVDLVIGHGAHPDPAGRLAAALARAGPHHPPVVGSVTGTRLDPQGRERQEARLREAGVLVAPSNAHACALALAAVTGERTETPADVPT